MSPFDSERNQSFSAADVRHVPCSPAHDVFFRFIASLSALLLIVLTVLPFTAPFASCDLAVLLSPEPSSRAAAIHHPGTVASLSDARTPASGGSFLDEEKFKQAALVPLVASVIGMVVPAQALAPSIRSSAPRLRLISLRV